MSERLDCEKCLRRL